jgi:2-C-methyl-D-erythritol 4-phosphate cytidylyltransferase
VPAASTSPVRAAVLVLAGGSGTRLGSQVNKVYLPLGGRPVLAWSLRWLEDVQHVSRVVVVSRPEDAAHTRHALRGSRDLVEVVAGGRTRHQSELAGLRHLRDAVVAGRVDVVVVHDGARPLAGSMLFRTVIEVAGREGGAVPVVPSGALVAASGDRVGPVPADEGALVRVQTPQAFGAAALMAAYEDAERTGRQGTDTAATVNAHGRARVVAVAGSRRNLKVTFAGDLAVAEHLLTHDPPP